MNALTVVEPRSNAEIFRESTDAAGLCREIVKRTAMKIQGREYVRVEGWNAIAIAHGCIATSYGTERLEPDASGAGGGYRAFGRITRMNDGAVLAEGVEGFVGDDEKMWAGRPVYARRAMCQTRAISRVCRSAFAHVVVLIDANLSTTPAEEVPDGGFRDEPMRNVTPEPPPAPKRGKASAVAAQMESNRDLEWASFEEATTETLNATADANELKDAWSYVAARIKAAPEDVRERLTAVKDARKAELAEVVS